MFARRLDVLFDQFKGPNFFADGPVDDRRYLESKPRVLYLLKEVHEKDNTAQWDLRDFLTEHIRSYETNNQVYQMWRHASKYLYGTYYNFPEWEEVNNIHHETLADCLRDAAFVNMKKTAGKASAIYKEIQRAGTDPNALWPKQIRLLEPELVLCGGNFWIAKNALKVKRVLGRDDGLKFFKHHNSIFIDFYHPGQRTYLRETIYNKLKDTVMSLDSLPR